MLQLEDYVHMIYLLNIRCYYPSVFIDRIYRNGRIVHLLCEPGKMQPHDLVDSTHRIVVIGCQSLVVNSDMFSVTHIMRTPTNMAMDLNSSVLIFPMASSSWRRRSIPPSI